jgi:hypothetical protein
VSGRRAKPGVGPQSARRHPPTTPPTRSAAPAPPGLLVGLALAAEAGHLAAAWTEWPTAAARGAFHAAAAAVLGMVAVAAAFHPGHRALPTLAGLIPLSWPVAALVGASPYRTYPTAAAVAVSAAAAAPAILAGLSMLRAGRQPSRSPDATTGRAVRHGSTTGRPAARARR